MQADLVVSIGGSTSGRAKYRRGMEYGDCLLHYYYNHYYYYTVITLIYLCKPISFDNLSYHWRSSHYAVTHMGNKNSNIQGRSPNVVKVIFHTIRNCS